MPVKGRQKYFLFIIVFALLAVTAEPQIRDWPDDEREGIKINYTEAKIPRYTLPDPLTLSSGEKVTDIETWIEKRRPEIVRLFEENQFGRALGNPEDVRFTVFDKGTPVFEAKALRKQVTIHFGKGPQADSRCSRSCCINLLLSLKRLSPETAVDTSRSPTRQ